VQEVDTMNVIVVIRFTYSCSENELCELAMDFASNVKPNVDGLVWKIFLNDPERRRSGGLYLFHDLETANVYLNGSHIQGFSRSTIVSDVSTDVFPVMRDASIRAGVPLPEQRELLGAVGT
ncbi:MAG: YdhR family protein, partial [Gammaproteobacteria bacterium]